VPVDREEGNPEGVPAPPDDPDALLAWAEACAVTERLDDLAIGDDGPAGTYLPGRHGEAFTYRGLLIDLDPSDPGRRRLRDAEASVRGLLHRIATLAARARAAQAFLDEQGRDPDDEALAAFLERLRAERMALRASFSGAARPAGTYEPAGARVAREPMPTLRYRERPLVGGDGPTGSAPDDVALPLLGWNEGPLRWAFMRGDKVSAGEVPAERRLAALDGLIDLIRDPRAAGEHEALAELLRLPAWQFALGAIDDRLSQLDAARGPTGAGAVARAERIAFRVTALRDGALGVEPVVQTRARGGGFSRGTRLPWFELPDRRDLTPADERAFRAHDDRFARRSNAWGGPLTPAQVFGILRALIDHPAVFFDMGTLGGFPNPPTDSVGPNPTPSLRRGAERLDIRQGRLRLRFASAPDHSLSAQFELLGVTLLPDEVARALRDDRHLVYLHRPREGEGDGGREGDGVAGGPGDEGDGPPRILLAEVSAPAAAVARALALAPARFPPEAHDALAARLEVLQESVDVELPSQWTRTIGAADGRLVVRLELLASGALDVRLVVRPVKLGPTFPPGEGPALLLEGQGHERHGARRDKTEERRAGHALAERLGLDLGAEVEPWRWRVGEGDPALHLVATLRELSSAGRGAGTGDAAADVTVEWADDERLDDFGVIGRRDLRMKVADRHDWFGVEGHARPRGAPKEAVVPLTDLLAAIREGRRYLPVGARGFVRIEESLREALARAEAAFFEVRGNPDTRPVALQGTLRATLQISAYATDPLVGLVEDEAQIEAATSFLALRRRIREGQGTTPRLTARLEATLRPYQRAGVTWLARLAHWGAGAILADEMGLGKTVQTLAVLGDRAALGPALVVAPTSVVANWVDEAARFVPELRVRLFRGPDRDACLRGLGPGDLLVTSYAIATTDAEKLAAIELASLVLDEAQAVKNATTERSRALRGLRAAWRLGLTGTPIENHLGEIWSLMRVISPGFLGSWDQFRGRFAVPIEKFGDDGRRRALSRLLRPFVLRRTKAEVAPELPPRTEVVRMVRLSTEERALYEELRLSTIDELTKATRDRERDPQSLRFVLLAALTRLRQLCCHPRLVYPRTPAGSAKAAYLLELLAELREGGHQVLVFSQFRSFLEILAPRLRQHGFRALVLDGTTPAETRERRIAAFQAGQAEVFLISLKAGGFGLNLTAADTVIHLDPWWNPAVEDQATARAHRIGQQRPVTAVRLVARGTIEESVLGLHAAKRALAAALLDGTDLAASLDTEQLVALIRSGNAGAF
jgi:superfamily II DNA or RNA helicase